MSTRIQINISKLLSYSLSRTSAVTHNHNKYIILRAHFSVCTWLRVYEEYLFPVKEETHWYAHVKTIGKAKLFLMLPIVWKPCVSPLYTTHCVYCVSNYTQNKQYTFLSGNNLKPQPQILCSNCGQTKRYVCTGTPN